MGLWGMYPPEDTFPKASRGTRGLWGMYPPEDTFPKASRGTRGLWGMYPPEDTSPKASRGTRGYGGCIPQKDVNQKESIKVLGENIQKVVSDIFRFVIQAIGHTIQSPYNQHDPK